MLIGTLISNILNIILVKVLTNRLSTEDFGTYSLIMAFTSFPQIILLAPLSAAIFPFFKKNDPVESITKLQNNIYELFIFINMILLVIPVMAWGTCLLFQISWSEYIQFFFLAVFFSGTVSILSIMDSISLANSKIKLFTLFPLFNLVLKILIALILFVYDAGPIRLIVYFSIGQFFFFLIEYAYLRRKKIILFSLSFPLKSVGNIWKNQKKEIIIYSSNLTLWGFFSWLQAFFDKWFLHQYFTSVEVGIYSVYFQYGFLPFVILSSVVSQYITPKYYANKVDYQSCMNFMQRLFKYLYITFPILLLGAPVIAYFLSPMLIELLTNSSYLKYIAVFPWIVSAGTFYFYGQIFAVPLMSKELVGRIRMPKIVSSLFAVLLFGILTPKYGVRGVVFSLLIANIFFLIIILKKNRNYMLKLSERSR